MKKTKFDQNLLNEELKRFKMLESYDFYFDEKEEPTYKEEELLLGSELDEEESEEENSDDLVSTDEVGDGDVSDEESSDEIEGELGLDTSNDTVGDIEEPVEEPVEEPIEEPVDDSVEVDVTSIVQGSEQATKAAQQATNNTEMLLKKFNDMEARLARMDSVSNKIDNLEREMVKRNPTPVEKLEMRTLDSAPFNQKLTDYWGTKEGPYDVMNKNKEKEYILTKDDIDYGYSESNVKKSFTNVSDYDEEDI